jgi:tetratricopeptide (TPR) repeat protein
MINRLSVLGILFFTLSFFSLSSQSLEEARNLTISEQYEAATEQFKQLVTRFPMKGEYWYYFGENLLQSENPDSAKSLFQEGVKQEPTNALNFIGLAKVHKLEGQMTEFSTALTRGVQLGVKNVDVLMRAAEAHIQYEPKDIPAAMALLQQAEKIDPKNPEIYILNGDAFLENNDGSSAIKFYEKAKTLAPGSPMALLRLGQLWVRARNYQGKDGQKGALEYYNEAIALNPGFAPAYRELGEIYAKAQRYQEAKENYAKYLELSKNNLVARTRYASFLYVTKDYTGAIQEIEQIQKQDSTKNLLNRLAGYSYFELKEYEKGLSSMERYFKKQPENKILPSDYAYMGKLLAANGSDSLGIEQFKIAIQKDSTSAELYSELATLYAKQKDFGNAVIYYEKKIALGKAITNDYFRMGQAFYNLKEYGKADTAFMKITESQPTLLVGHLWRGRANSNLDPDSKLGLAKIYYEEVVKLGEADSVKYSDNLKEAYKYLGFFYYINEDFSNSRTWWEKVKAIDPADKQALDALADMKGK